jgi:hypothetical protein
MNDKGNIDLSSLKSIDLGPNWDQQKRVPGIKPKDFSKRKKNYVQKKKSYKKDLLNYEINPSYCAKTLNKIKEGIKKIGKSFEFTEIVDLILEKKQIRLKITVKNKDSHFIKIVKNNQIFEDLDTAVNALTRHYADYYDLVRTETVKRDSNFNVLTQCPVTKILLPPKSYHNFKEEVMIHYLESQIQESFDKYLSLIEEYKEKENINDYNQAEREIKIYTRKGDKNELYGLEKVRKDILNHGKGLIFKEIDSFTIHYKELENLKLKSKINFNFNYCKKEITTKVKKDLMFSNFSFFNHENKYYTVYSKKKSAKDLTLNNICTKILARISENQNINIKELLSNSKFPKYETKDILREIKWLAKEGFLRELKDGTLIIS